MSSWTYEAIVFLFTVSISFALVVCDHAEQQILDILALCKEQSGDTGMAGMSVWACLYVCVFSHVRKRVKF